ncbi:hypothetical protein SAMN05720354_10248 [Nitrosospira sp. Nsp1]|nr:hypothetical protein SAMN05720354_10248 [Nitrosospira sp. Nsp1]
MMASCQERAGCLIQLHDACVRLLNSPGNNPYYYAQVKTA